MINKYKYKNATFLYFTDINLLKLNLRAVTKINADKSHFVIDLREEETDTNKQHISINE